MSLQEKTMEFDTKDSKSLQTDVSGGMAVKMPVAGEHSRTASSPAIKKMEWVWGIGLAAIITLAIFGLIFTRLQSKIEDLSAGLQPETVALEAGPVEQSAPVSDPRIALSATSAKAGSVAAEQRAIVWQSDAQLVGISVTWEGIRSLTEVNAGNSNWAFTYYSPTANKAALVTSAGDLTELNSRDSKRTSLQAVSKNSWQVDSADVVALFIDNGGQPFLVRSGSATMTMTLTSDKGRLKWFASLISDTRSIALTMLIDAGTGEILFLDNSSK